MRLVALLVLAALAGCVEPESVDEPVAGPAPQLHGFILDEALVPVAGAEVTVPAVNATAATDDEGRYTLDSLPTEQPLVFIVQKEGYVPTSKSITLLPDERTRLNFTLTKETIQEPYFDVEEALLFLACGVSFAGPQGQGTYDCGGTDDRHDDQRDFAIGPGAVGVVVEAAWEARTDAGRELRMLIETVGYGDQDQILGDVLGQTILKVQIPAADVARYYSDGGHVRITLEPAVDTGSAEAGTGQTVIVEQEVEVFVSVFYVEGPPTTYSVAG